MKHALVVNVQVISEDLGEKIPKLNSRLLLRISQVTKLGFLIILAKSLVLFMKAQKMEIQKEMLLK